MRKISVFYIGFLICSIFVRCKKEPTTDVSYQLDSVIVGTVDTLGVYTRGLALSADTGNASFLSAALNTGIPQLIYRHHSDSIITELHTESCANSPNTELLNYSVIISDKFDLSYHASKIGCYGQDGLIVYNQSMQYNGQQRLESELNYYYFMVGGGFLNEAIEKNSYLFSGSTLSAIQTSYKEYTNDRSDSLMYSVVNSFSYTHYYKNQKALIGIDVNDLILNLIIQYTPWLNYTFPLIISNTAGYRTKSDFLIEHIHFPMIPYTNIIPNYEANSLLKDSDIFVEYTFDMEHADRIRTMTIRPDTGDATRYTFIYKD